MSDEAHGPEIPMDCRHFRQQHACFIDDSLSSVETKAMSGHRESCASCSKADAQVRRALMVARSARTIRPSAGFEQRLAARLAAERKLRRPSRSPERLVSAGLAAAAVVAFLIVGSVQNSPAVRAPGAALVLAPVVVTPPPLPSDPTAGPALLDEPAAAPANYAVGAPVRVPAYVTERRARVPAMHASIDSTR